MRSYIETYDDPDPIPPDHDPECWLCSDSGWRDVKSPDDSPGMAYCTCAEGQRRRKEARERQEADWHAAHEQGLWLTPDAWPW